ncbi:MAG: cell division protein FtsX [Desulfomonilia bacterium]
MRIMHTFSLIGRGLSLRPWGSMLTLIACWFALTQLLLVIYAMDIARRTTLLPGTTGSMVAYLADSVEPEEGVHIGQTISGMPEITKVTYIPREEGLQRIREWLGTGSPLTDDVEASILPNALEIRVKPQVEGEIDRIATRVKEIPGISDVHFHSGILGSIAGAYRTIFFFGGLTACVVITCLSLVIFLSIRVGIVSRHREIEVLTILGAGFSYLYTPYLLEAGMHALIGSALALGTVWLCISSLHTRFPLSTELIPALSAFHVIAVVCFASLCSLTGAVLAVRRSIYA